MISEPDFHGASIAPVSKIIICFLSSLWFWNWENIVPQLLGFKRFYFSLKPVNVEFPIPKSFSLLGLFSQDFDTWFAGSLYLDLREVNLMFCTDTFSVRLLFLISLELLIGELVLSVFQLRFWNLPLDTFLLFAFNFLLLVLLGRTLFCGYELSQWFCVMPIFNSKWVKKCWYFH